MSLVICVHVGEGIVMASDSRITYSHTDNVGNTIIQRIGIHTTDTTNKTFICPNNIGISTCGDASIEGKPITGYIETFVREFINGTTDIDTIPDELIKFFNSYSNVPDATFFVAGYKKIEDVYEQIIWRVIVKHNIKTKENTQYQGAVWAGETDIINRLIQNIGIKNADGTYIDLPQNNILWNYFTLQDAIDFADYAIKTTVDTMKFQNRNKTVGGPTDILILKPNESQWLRKKSLL